MKLLRAIGLFVIVTLIDIFLTLRGVSERCEGNPIIRFYMDWLGPIPGLILFKIITVGGAIFLLICASRKGGRHIESIFYAGAIVTLLLSSLWLI